MPWEAGFYSKMNRMQPRRALHRAAREIDRRIDRRAAGRPVSRRVVISPYRGDSGQHDPEIYLRVIQAHPERILAAFIRDVTPNLRDRGVAKIVEESNAAGVEMVYVRDSDEALEHARRKGLLAADR